MSMLRSRGRSVSKGRSQGSSVGTVAFPVHPRLEDQSRRKVVDGTALPVMSGRSSDSCKALVDGLYLHSKGPAQLLDLGKNLSRRWPLCA